MSAMRMAQNSPSRKKKPKVQCAGREILSDVVSLDAEFINARRWLVYKPVTANSDKIELIEADVALESATRLVIKLVGMQIRSVVDKQFVPGSALTPSLTDAAAAGQITFEVDNYAQKLYVCMLSNTRD